MLPFSKEKAALNYFGGLFLKKPSSNYKFEKAFSTCDILRIFFQYFPLC